MKDRRHNSLLGLAVMRGLISPQELGKAALTLPEGGRLMEAVLAQGLLLPADLQQLSELMEGNSLGGGERREPLAWPTQLGQGPEPVDAPRTSDSLGAWDGASRPVLPSTMGRQVLDATRLRTWKHYRNLAFLGEGGMGRIFQAFDPLLNREVALKFLARDEPEKIIRFVLEAQHQAKVDHPNICKVFEVGEWKGQSYIAMQLIRGKNLAEAREEMTLEEKVGVMQVVAEAIHAAHRQGLTHRDLKPGNIMVERDGAQLKPYILDFGLARGLEATGLTQQGVAVGTLGYMAPEQARGDQDAVGFHSDIYGMGATLYMLLAGDPPFGSSSGLELLRRTVEEEPPPMSTLALNLPRDLDTIVLKCLEKDPGRRYASALALAEDLRRFLAGEPLLAAPPDYWDALRKKLRRNRTVSMVVGVAAAIVLVLAAWAGRAQWRAHAQSLLAQSFGMESARLAGSYRWAQMLPLHDMGPHKRAMRAWMGRLEAQMRQQGSVARGPGNFALGQTFLTLGEPDKALARLEQAWRAGYRGSDCSELLGLAHGAVFQEGVEAALGQSTKALMDIRLGELKRLHGDQALYYLRLSGTTLSLVHEGRLAYLETHYEEALAKAQLALDRDPWLVEANLLIGQARLARGRRSLAQGGYEAAGQDAAEAVLAGARVEAMARSDVDGYVLEADGQRLAMELAAARALPFAEAAERCRAALEKALQADPEAAPAHLKMAQLFMQLVIVDVDQGRDPEPDLAVAMGHCQAAMRDRPDDPAPIIAQAIICYNRAAYRSTHGQDPLPSFEQSLALGQQAITLRPQDYHPHLNQGLTFQIRATYLQKHGRDPRADLQASIAEVTTACQLDPGIWIAWANRGIPLRRLASLEDQEGGDPLPYLAQAQECYRQALACNSRSSTIYNNLGILCKFKAEMELKRGLDPRASFEAAVAALKQSLAIKPGMAFSVCGLGDVAFLRGMANRLAGRDPAPAFQEALARYREALVSNPADGGFDEKAGIAYLEMALQETAQGRSSSACLSHARQAFLEGLRIDRSSNDSLMGLARVQLLGSALGEAAATAAKAQAVTPEAAEPLLLEAEIAVASAERGNGKGRAKDLGRAEGFLKASETWRNRSPLRKVLQAQVLLLRDGRVDERQAWGGQAEALLQSAFQEDRFLGLRYRTWLTRAGKAEGMLKSSAQ